VEQTHLSEFKPFPDPKLILLKELAQENYDTLLYQDQVKDRQVGCNKVLFSFIWLSHLKVFFDREAPFVHPSLAGLWLF